MNNDKELLQELNEAIQQKINKRKSQFHESHSRVYNDNLQIEIDTLEWVLEQIQMYAKKVITTERIRDIVEAKIIDLERRMEKANTYGILIHYLQRLKLSNGFCMLFMQLGMKRYLWSNDRRQLRNEG